MIGGPQLARIAAVAIAVAAIIDPAITSRRTSKPEIAIVAARRDSLLANSVERELRDGYRVVRGSLGAAAATVFVGDRVPEHTSGNTAPAFVVTQKADRGVTIEHVEAPASVALSGSTSISAIVRARGARGKNVDVELFADGVRVDRVTMTMTTDDEAQHVSLKLTPRVATPEAIRITAAVDKTTDAANTASTDFVVDVSARKIPILFYDPTPSWSSTFVRRSIEADARFTVESRAHIARNIASRAGAAPATLAQSSSLDRYDAIVVGTPSLLASADIDGLVSFMRRRGGAVILLLDQFATGPYERLTGGVQWRATSDARLRALRTPDNPADTVMIAAELVSPATLPAGAHVIAAADNEAVVWEMPHGDGRVIVSGAADAWRFRDPARSSFNTFWTDAIAAAANNTPDPVMIRVDRGVRAAHDVAYITVSTRGNAGSAPRAALDVPGTTPRAIRLYATETAGEWRGAFRVPAEPGTYRVNVSGDVGSATAPIVVAENPESHTPAANDLLTAWAVSRGGAAITASEIAELPDAIAQRIHPPAVRVRWYPMRSPWWILPFALALSAEWYWRRRRGLL